MFLKLVVVIALIISIECKQSYIIRGPGWKNSVEKCINDGDGGHTYNFNIGTLNSTGFGYDDVKSSTSVKARGFFELRTKSSGSETEEELHLKDYTEDNGVKQFSKKWKRSTTSGWATQTVAIILTVRIHEDTGLIELKSHLYAGSWWAVTCAWSKAFVDSVEFINY